MRNFILIFSLCFFSAIYASEPLATRSSPFQSTNNEVQAIRYRSTPDKAVPGLIAFDFDNAPVRKILKRLAHFAGINMVMSEAVNGQMSLHLRDVSWQQALSAILSAQGLAQERQNAIVLIDKPANFSARKQRQEEDALQAQKWLPLESVLLRLRYAKATDIAKILKEQNNTLLSERGRLSVDLRTNTIWLLDNAQRVKRIKHLLNALDVPVQQIMIEARIVDINKQYENDLGIRWGISKPGHLSGTLAGANQLTQSSASVDANHLAERLNMDLAAMPVLGTPASLGLALAKIGGGALLDLELSALESEGRAEVIASPRLVTTNQHVAVIESGQDIPYQQSTASGGTSVAFKKAVLSLKVTPQIRADHQLLMDLVISEDADSGQRVQGVPIIVTKTLQTHVLVKDGQTIVLGGIYKRAKHHHVTRIPFWGRLPVIGVVFRRTELRNENEELLIFITPRIISDDINDIIAINKA